MSFSSIKKKERGKFLSCSDTGRGKGAEVSSWWWHGHTALQEIRWLSHCFFCGVSTELVHPSGCESMLSLQSSKVFRATCSMQKWWYSVCVGSAWATTCPIGYCTMDCLKGTRRNHHHSAEELKESIRVGDCTVLFSQKTGRRRSYGIWKVQANCSCDLGQLAISLASC